MTLHLAVLGIDGSGKSTVTAALPALLAARFEVRAGAAGEQFLLVDPDQDHLAPNFHPDGLPLAARLSKLLKRAAKRVVDNRRLYPAVKLAQLFFQDQAAQSLARRYQADVMASDGNTLLSATGRAANYLRPASGQAAPVASGPAPEDLRAVFEYVLDGTPIPASSQRSLPRLAMARRLYRVTRMLGLRGVWLPDAVVFLDIPAATALARIAARGGQCDRHENESDLNQARQMYLRTLEAFAQHHSPAAVFCLPVADLSPGETLVAVADALRPLILARREQGSSVSAPLGTTQTRLTGASMWRRVLTFRYLVRYLLSAWFRGAWREPLFAFSGLGKLFMKEGYSASVMRVIYDQDERRYGLADRVFLEYPLHRAVYDRLGILTRRLQGELEQRLRQNRTLAILTAPSGFAYDLFRPLEAIAAQDPETVRRVRVVAVDLDPAGALRGPLTARAHSLGIAFEFLRGDITDPAVRAQMEAAAPYDAVLFVGLSSWLPKPRLRDHICWVRNHLAEDGLLVSDCFTPEAYALSGRYVGYRANYYTPDTYSALMDSCGFDGLNSVVESGRDRINHVVVVRLRNSEH